MAQLRRELTARDLTLFAVTSIFGSRWIASAAHAGSGAILLWIAAGFLFAIPLALCTSTLSTKYPGAGGLYVWARNDFGPWHGFLSFWVYWMSIACWFPGAAMFYVSSFLYGIDPRLAENRALVVAGSLCVVWIALGTNLIGLRIGRWTQNMGAVSSFLLALLLVVGAILRPSEAASHLQWIPALRWDTINTWATIAYGLSGIELIGMMGGEVRDPARTIPRAAVSASLSTCTLYSVSTLAMLILLRPEQIDELTGLAQAGAVVNPQLAPVVSLLVLLGAVGQFGGLGSAVSRMPFVAGVDHLLPPAFARIHERWATPYVAILMLGGIASGLLIVMQIGDTMRAAYQTIVSLMVIGGFLPYLYLFTSAWKAARRFSAVSGMSVTFLAIASSTVPSADVRNVGLFEARLALGTIVVIASARAVYLRYTRKG